MDSSRSQITGLVLAGGRASRMGGVDKGMQLLAGQPLALHAAQRLAPQVGPVLVNANRHLADYASLGYPLVPDTLPDHPGPLAGLLAGLDACSTPWLVTVPCDSPHFPLDLVARLVAGLQGGPQRVAMAATDAVLKAAVDGSHQTDRPNPGLQPQPVFCLLHRSLRDSLAAFASSGRRSVDGWARAQGVVLVRFADPGAFVNANTLAELAALESLESVIQPTTATAAATAAATGPAPATNPS